MKKYSEFEKIDDDVAEKMVKKKEWEETMYAARSGSTLYFNNVTGEILLDQGDEDDEDDEDENPCWKIRRKIK